MLMVTDSFSFSSNLTVAAEWNTIETLLKSMAYEVKWISCDTNDLAQVVSPGRFPRFPALAT